MRPLLSGSALVFLTLSQLVRVLGHPCWAEPLDPAHNASIIGESPYGRWSNGPSTSANFFPIAVWLQSPTHIAEFKDIGINVFVGFWGDLDEGSLAVFSRNGMPLIPGQDSVGLAAADNHAIIGWSQPDEPDNAQPNGILGHRPCLTPGQIVAGYDAIKAKDTTRPVLLNFGRGVSATTWIGRGTCIGQTTSYYPQGATSSHSTSTRSPNTVVS